MSESLTHQHLVRHLVGWLQNQVEDIAHGSIYSDLPTDAGIERPPQLSGYVPDVLCRIRTKSTLYVGEAKTARDLETDHSRKQFSAFLAYLARIEPGTLVIAVPWHTVNRARSLIKFIQQQTDTIPVKVIVLDQLPG